MKIPLSVPTFTHKEFAAVKDCFDSGDFTMGKRVEAFEKAFAKYIGTKEAVMVNSGSSANLLALAVMTNPHYSELRRGDEVITPAVTWATTVFPIAQMGLVPVLVDVEEDYTISPEAIEKAISPKTKAIMPVHLLGNPARMKEIMEIADKYNLSVIEDCCEAHGAEVMNAKVGSIGDMGTFSFFFSHHISTIEGGMITTDNSVLADLLRAMRAFGWIRSMSAKDTIAKTFPAIDPRFLFITTGYNLRPTELQGAIGLVQLPKLEGFIKQRRENMAWWNKKLQDLDLILPEEREGTRHVSFAYGISTRLKDKLVPFLESRGIETRPVMTGNITTQPALKEIQYRVSGRLVCSEFTQNFGFLIGNHSGIGKIERTFVRDTIEDFFEIDQ